mgnify:CR=1 FL=1
MHLPSCVQPEVSSGPFLAGSDWAWDLAGIATRDTPIFDWSPPIAFAELAPANNAPNATVAICRRPSVMSAPAVRPSTRATTPVGATKAGVKEAAIASIEI